MIRRIAIAILLLPLTPCLGADAPQVVVDPALAPPVRISPVGENAVHFYFQQCPESPDGKRVVYTVFRKQGAADIYVSDRNGNNPKHIGAVLHSRRHTGADAIWIDNHRVAYCDATLLELHIVHVDTGEEKTMVGAVDQYSPALNRIVFCSRGGRLPMGIYSVDLETTECRTLVDLEKVRPFADTMKKPFDPELWKLDHPYWSPDSTRITFVIKAEGWKPKSKPHAFSFVADADGSNIRFVCPKPMHVQWWDDKTIFGHDDWMENDKHLKRWDLEGNMVEHIAGYGCHGAVSPDRQWIATESWYSSDPIVLRLYRRGQTENGRILYVQPRHVDGVDFWKTRSHIHPAFSRDGRRIYFNARPSGAGGSQVFALDISPLLKPEPKP